MDKGAHPAWLGILGFCYFALFVFVNAHLGDNRMLARVNSAPNEALSAEPVCLRDRKPRYRQAERLDLAATIKLRDRLTQSVKEYYA